MILLDVKKSRRIEVVIRKKNNYVCSTSGNHYFVLFLQYTVFVDVHYCGYIDIVIELFSVHKNMCIVYLLKENCDLICGKAKGFGF